MSVVIGDLTIPGDVVGLVVVLLGVLATAMLGLFGWGLKQTVELGQIVATMKVTHEDHERRISQLEGELG